MSVGSSRLCLVICPETRHMRAIGPVQPARLQPAGEAGRACVRSSRRQVEPCQGVGSPLHPQATAIRLPWLCEAWGLGDGQPLEHVGRITSSDAPPDPRSSILSASWPLRCVPAALCAPAPQVHNPFCWIEAARELISLSVAPPNFSPLDGRDAFTPSPSLPSSTFPTPSFSTLFSPSYLHAVQR